MSDMQSPKDRAITAAVSAAGRHIEKTGRADSFKGWAKPDFRALVEVILEAFAEDIRSGDQF